MAISKQVLKKIEKLKDHYGELAESLVQLEAALENDSDEEIESALDGIPTEGTLARNAEQLSELLESAPWKKKVKK